MKRIVAFVKMLMAIVPLSLISTGFSAESVGSQSDMDGLWGARVVKLRAEDAKRGQLFDQGGAPLGPFHELEMSSPAAALKPNETMQHVQQTWHLKGSEKQLKELAYRLLGADLSGIEKGFVGK